jgi:hypothetical protein
VRGQILGCELIPFGFIVRQQRQLSNFNRFVAKAVLCHGTAIWIFHTKTDWCERHTEPFLARGSSCHFECVLGKVVAVDFYDFLAKVLPEKKHVRSSANTSLRVEFGQTILQGTEQASLDAGAFS